jgi:hypothetical protein
MKTPDLFRKLLKKEKSMPIKEESCEPKVEYETVYTHAFDSPSKNKFVGTHREGNAKYKKMKIKEVKSNNEDELTM